MNKDGPSPNSSDSDLRVVHVISSLRIGGAERHVVDLLNAMRCQFRAIVLIGDEPAELSFVTLLDPSIDLHRCRIRRNNVATGLWRLAALLRSMQCDVVHCHMFHASLYGSLAARLAGVRAVVTTEHGENPWKQWQHHWLERQVISRLVDLRFCVSPRILERRSIDSGVPASKLRVTVNGTPLPIIEPQSGGGRIPVVGSVGRLIPEKDYGRLLNAIAVLRDRGLRFRACIVGDGPEMANLQRLVDDLDLAPLVELPGMTTNVGQWYRTFDVFVSSSFLEGQPVALIEAMAYGVAVVATDVGASAETVVHGCGGLVIPPNDTVALADAIEMLLNDADLRGRLGINARRRVESHYSIDAVAAAHLSCYSELLQQKIAV